MQKRQRVTDDRSLTYRNSIQTKAITCLWNANPTDHLNIEYKSKRSLAYGIQTWKITCISETNPSLAYSKQSRLITCLLNKLIRSFAYRIMTNPADHIPIDTNPIHHLPIKYKPHKSLAYRLQTRQITFLYFTNPTDYFPIAYKSDKSLAFKIQNRQSLAYIVHTRQITCI